MRLSQAAPFTARLRFPHGYQVPPHYHPNVERVTVLDGTFHLGMGETADPGKLTPLPTGSIAIMPPGMRHFIRTEGPTVIQLHGTGPWSTTYVDPADDPRKQWEELTWLKQHPSSSSS